MRKFYFYAIFSCVISSVCAQIRINEISLCNVNEQLDPNYDYTGWVELYNGTDTEVNLQDLYFSDERTNYKKYKLSVPRILPAKGYAAIWLNGEVKDAKKGLELDLDAEGGTFYVSDAKGFLIDSLSYPAQFTGISYGVVGNGTITKYGYFLETTFLKENISATASFRVETPVLSQKSGFYEGPLSVTINSSSPGSKVFYTLDGSEPTPEKGMLYTSPVSITKTTTLRAQAYADNYLNGIPANATYMIGERKPDMSVVFLSIDTTYLYNDTIGIYCVGTNGSNLASTFGNFNRDWTRPGYFEYFDNLESESFKQYLGLAISGNVSRAYPQKAFQVKASKRFGNNKLNFPFFKDVEGGRYKSLLLRCGGQFYLDGALIRDAGLQQMANVTSLTYQSYTPVVVYINGQYWGLYNIRERNSKDNLYTHYGYKKNEFDLIENNWGPKAVHGTKDEFDKLEKWIKEQDQSNDDIYRQTCGMVDIDNYMYYMAIELLIANDDWPLNNQKLFRYKAEGSKWRWILNDLDKALLQPKLAGNKFKEMKDGGLDAKLSQSMLFHLLKNKQFEEKFIDVQCLVAGSVYRPDRFARKINLMRDRLVNEFPYYKERWKDQGRGDITKAATGIISLEKFACQRAYENLQENFSLGTPHALYVSSSVSANTPIMFNGMKIPVLPYDGKYFEGRKLVLDAPLYDDNSRFKYWEVSHSDGSVETFSMSSLSIDFSDSVCVRAIYDKAEKTRRSGLYLNEVSADNAIFVDNMYKVEDWIEVYNTSDIALDLAGYCLSLSKNKLDQFRFMNNNDETIIKGHGYGIIWCSKSPGRGAMHTNFKLPKEGATVYLSKENENGWLQIVDSIQYVSHTTANTVGRFPDGAENITLFDYPTFKKANQYSSCNELIYTEDYPLVSDVHNVYSADGRVSLVTDEKGDCLKIQSEVACKLTIYNLDGSLVQSEVSIKPGAQVVNIHNLPKGIYLVKIMTNQMNVFKIRK